MTTQDLAKKLKVAAKTVLSWIKSGELKASKVRVKGVTRFEISDVEASKYLEKVNATKQ